LRWRADFHMGFLIHRYPKVHRHSVVGRGRADSEAGWIRPTDRNANRQEIARRIQETAVGVRIAADFGDAEDGWCGADDDFDIRSAGIVVTSEECDVAVQRVGDDDFGRIAVAGVGYRYLVFHGRARDRERGRRHGTQRIAYGDGTFEYSQVGGGRNDVCRINVIAGVRVVLRQESDTSRVGDGRAGGARVDSRLEAQRCVASRAHSADEPGAGHAVVSSLTDDG